VVSIISDTHEASPQMGQAGPNQLITSISEGMESNVAQTTDPAASRSSPPMAFAITGDGPILKRFRNGQGKAEGVSA